MGGNMSAIEHAYYFPARRNMPSSFQTGTPPPQPKMINASHAIATATAAVLVFRTTEKFNAHMNASKHSNKLIVIDFTAKWCGPCRHMEPTINELAAKYTDVQFIKVDVDELPVVGREYGIQAMPTFVLIKNGKQVDKIVGAKKDELQMKIEYYRV